MPVDATRTQTHKTLAHSFSNLATRYQIKTLTTNPKLACRNAAVSRTLKTLSTVYAAKAKR